MTAFDDDVSFDIDQHQYRNAKGDIRPSVTATLQVARMFDYSRVPPAVLERKRIIGQNVHAWTAAHDAGDSVDLCDLTPDEEGYARGWLKFRADFGRRLQVMEIERKMLGLIGSLEVGGTPDRKVRIDNRIHILDIKCVTTFHPEWRLQLADYVMLATERQNCSAFGRCIVRLQKDGTYRYDPIDPKWDEVDSAVAISAANVYVWMSNHRLI